MSNLKDERIAEVLREFAAEYINRESNKTSLITITRVEILNRGKRAIVYFTTLPDSEQETALKFLQRKRRDFRKFVMDKKPIAFAPSFDFQIDFGEKNRQRIDELSNQG